MKDKRYRAFLIIVLILSILVAVYFIINEIKDAKTEKNYAMAIDCIIERDYDKAMHFLREIEDKAYKDRQDLFKLCQFAKAINDGHESINYPGVKSADYLHCNDEQRQHILNLRKELIESYKLIQERVEAEKLAQASAEAARLKKMLPYVGMSESDISKTSLGSYSSKRKNTYYYLGENHPYTVYEFKEGNTSTFDVRCENGVVTHVSDYRKNKPVNNKSVSDEDRYNASDYRNPDDFYDDNYYSFHDYYQAEKYWNEHHDK